MISRRHFVRLAGIAGIGTVAGCGGPSTTNTTIGPHGLAFESRAFTDGGTIPVAYTADGADRSPPLTIKSLADGTETLSLIVDDPDAPGGPFVHWLLWNVPAKRREIPSGIPQRETLPELGGARQGTNGFGEIGYSGPAPPAGDDPHTYRFTLYAVDRSLDVESGAKRSALESALEGAVRGRARITATYDR
ncbi:MAG: YbhB/YbcL family Raf kinase inhibitor-like protein [Halorhabdus sp.]